MIITLGQLAVHRNFDPNRFEDFAARAENQKYLTDSGTVNADHVDDLIRDYRSFVGEDTLVADRQAIYQWVNDRR